MNILKALDAALTTLVNELFPLPPAVFNAEWLAEKEAAEEVSEPVGFYNQAYGWDCSQAIRELNKARWCFLHKDLAGNCGCGPEDLADPSHQYPQSTPSDVASAGVPAGVSPEATPSPAVASGHPLDLEELESAAHAVRWFATNQTDFTAAWRHLADRLDEVSKAMK